MGVLAPYTPPTLLPEALVASSVESRLPLAEFTRASMIPPSVGMFTPKVILSTSVRSTPSYAVHEPSSIERTCSSEPMPEPTVIPSDEAENLVASYLVVLPSDLVSSKYAT